MLEQFARLEPRECLSARACRCAELPQLWTMAALHLGDLDHSQKSSILFPQFCVGKPVEDSAAPGA